MRHRNRHVSVWLTDAEHAHLKKQCELAGLGIDPFLRNLILGVQLRPRPPDEYTALLRELSAIGNNINQIAHIANGTKEITQGELSAAIELNHRAWRLVKDAF